MTLAEAVAMLRDARHNLHDYTFIELRNAMRVIISAGMAEPE